MKKILLTVISLLVISQAFALTYEVKNVKTRVFPEESLQYTINFTNDASENIHVYINTINFINFGTVSVKPSVNLYLDPNESIAVNLTITVRADMIPGEYITPLIVTYNSTTEKINILSTILYKSVEPVKLQNLTLVGTYTADPRNPFNITGTIVSNVDEVYPRFNVVISNENRIIYNSSSIVKFTKGLNEFTKEIVLDPKLEPGEYTLLVEAIVGGKVITQSAKTLRISSYKNSSISVSATEDLFGKRILKTINNTGNEDIVVNINHTSNPLESFLITSIEYKIYEGNKLIEERKFSSSDMVNNMFARNVTLKRGQSALLTINISYLPLTLLPFFVLLAIFAIVVFNRKIKVAKEIILSKREGKELLIKIAIRVKNIGFKPVNEVLIIEDIPLYVKKLGGFGSIKGEVDKVKRWLKFNCGTLRPREEVLISYKFKTDVELVGRVSLPPALVKFKYKGKIKEVKSNTPIIEIIKGGEP